MIRFTESRIPMGRDKRLYIEELTLNPGELWVVAGPGGSGKSSLARAIAGAPDRAGYRVPIPGLSRSYPHSEEQPMAWISFDRERDIRETLRHNDDSEVLGRPDEGTTLDTFIGGSSGRAFLNPDLLTKLDGRGIKNLSTGEFRQVFIAREAGKSPSLAVLDEPFEGLDPAARKRLTVQLEKWSESDVLIVITVNRLEDIPHTADGIVLLNGRGITASGKPEVILGGLTAAEKTQLPVPAIPAAPAVSEHPDFLGESLIEMNRLSLSFNGRKILENINWNVKSGESWILTGPNGSGKTTLLNLISGDEPRGYGQDLKLFGRKRGSGEKISDIKEQIGQVSAFLQESISRHATAVEVIGSGLRGSLVLTTDLDGFEAALVEQWLDVLGLKGDRDTAFFRLPYGERRLAMIGRAMIKHPRLLLLDEPMHGLDETSRDRVRSLIEILIRDTHTSVLFVSHRKEDAPEVIPNHIRLIPSKDGGPSRADISRSSTSL